ncbi:unnamed protein product [Dibothriocephalus latus]|uniref:Uncharacterized protein n=1 Tax=Dibothriocephalus latus TaxID=60516 RepID=A0A3P7LFF6_DIBLA|nr:unnamed protein product [Dibothriocephalus latus]
MEHGVVILRQCWELATCLGMSGWFRIYHVIMSVAIDRRYN